MRLRLFLMYLCWGVAIALSYGLIHLSLIPGRLHDALLITLLVPLVIVNMVLAYAVTYPLIVLGGLSGLCLLGLTIYRAIDRNISQSPGHKVSQQKGTVSRYRPWLLRSAVACLSLSVLAVTLRLPSRAALALSRSAFQARVAQAPLSAGQMHPQQLGFYTVESYARDPRGGVYFVVNTDELGGLWSEGYDISRGYVYQPNSDGSPFGDESYYIWHLFSDWYEFQAIEPISR